jgi:3-hydroxybutyryl-CoA dehydrogenase
MNSDDIKQVCVIGAGTMGSQIALQCALSGFTVHLTDAIPAALERGMEGNRALVGQRVGKGRITQEVGDATLARLHAINDVAEAARAADFVIEAAFEDLTVKRGLFTKLDEVCRPDAILTSNSSTIVISKIVDGTLRDPSRAANFHFFHPATVMKLVEVSKGPATSDATAQTCMDFARKIGKEPVLVEKEVYGFIVNYILGGLSRAAFQLYEGGYASIEDIDKSLKLGLGHPMGPFELADFSGVDITYNAMLQRYNETGDPGDKPPAFLEEMVREGRLGRKSGRGFYDYTPKSAE